MSQAIRTFVLGLTFLMGCRAVGADAADGAVGGSDSGADPGGPTEPTRLEPPIVQAAQKVSVDTLAGSAVGGSADGVGAAAQFDNPVGVVVDGTGLLVTEYDGGRLRRVSWDGATSTLSTGWLEPFGIIATAKGIYVQTDRDRDGNKGANTGTLWRVNAADGAVEIVASNLGRPRGLAQLVDGRIVLSDRERRTVSILDPANGSITLLAGAGIAGLVDGQGASARFADPYGVSVLPDGSLVVADRANHCVRRVTLDGRVTVFAGDGKPGMRDDSDKLRARFDGPIDVAADAAGNVYVSDGGNHRIRRVSTAGVVETIAGDGTAGFADGAGAAARFYGQEQIDVTLDGKTLYVADGTGGEGASTPYNRIRRITLE